MFYETKIITLPGGVRAELSQPDPGRAEEMLGFLRDVSGETENLLRTPADVTETIELEAAILQGFLASPSLTMIVCWIEGEIAGDCHVTWREKNKIRHRASVGIALRQKYWGMGIGTALFTELETIARQNGIRQMELEMVDGNQRGLALYTKMGYRITGRRPDAFRMQDGTFRDEILMTKML